MSIPKKGEGASAWFFAVICIFYCYLGKPKSGNERKSAKYANSSNTNNVYAFMKIYDSQERIKLTVLCDFF